jgi:hypothetical protein
MSANVITKNGLDLTVKEIKGRRVVTLHQIAKLHKTDQDKIGRNYRNNKNRFIQEVDYFNLRPVNITEPRLFFTESGYLMLVKSLTDDLSWQVQRELVNGYFRKPVNTFEAVLKFMPWEVQQLVRYRVGHRLTQDETGKLIGWPRSKVQEVEKQLRAVGYEPPHYNGMRTAPAVTQLQLNMGM